MNYIFKPEDFALSVNANLQRAEELRLYNCEFVNRRIKEVIETWPEVRINRASDGKINNMTTVLDYAEQHKSFWTHKARLAFIEEIPKEPCKHEPEMFRDAKGYYIAKYVCQFCGVKLDYKAEWKEKT